MSALPTSELWIPIGGIALAGTPRARHVASDVDAVRRAERHCLVVDRSDGWSLSNSASCGISLLLTCPLSGANGLPETPILLRLWPSLSPSRFIASALSYLR